MRWMLTEGSTAGNVDSPEGLTERFRLIDWNEEVLAEGVCDSKGIEPLIWSETMEDTVNLYFLEGEEWVEFRLQVQAHINGALERRYMVDGSPRNVARSLMSALIGTTLASHLVVNVTRMDTGESVYSLTCEEQR